MFGLIILSPDRINVAVISICSLIISHQKVLCAALVKAMRVKHWYKLPRLLCLQASLSALTLIPSSVLRSLVSLSPYHTFNVASAPLSARWSARATTDDYICTSNVLHKLVISLIKIVVTRPLTSVSLHDN